MIKVKYEKPKKLKQFTHHPSIHIYEQKTIKIFSLIFRLSSISVTIKTTIGVIKWVSGFIPKKDHII